MKTIEEVKNYLKKELELKQITMLTHYKAYKIFQDKNLKETAKDLYTKYSIECDILEELLSKIEG